MGNRSYDELRGEFYPLLNAIIYCYDITSLTSFECLENWRREAEPLLKKECVVYVVGMKADMNSARQITDKKVQSWVKSKSTRVAEVSAKASAGTEKLLKELYDL